MNPPDRLTTIISELWDRLTFGPQRRMIAEKDAQLAALDEEIAKCQAEMKARGL